MRFIDRSDAGRRLAEALAGYKGSDVVVYALPRGGVVLGKEIARSLGAPLDLVITRKIGYPGNEECAVCAVAEDGHMICDGTISSLLDQEWLLARAKEEMQEAKRRRQVYLRGRGQLSPEGKTAIIVDDGVATGLTILLAIKEIRHRSPRKIVVAVPVSSREAADRIRKEADELVVLETPVHFMAVGEHYEQFPQLTDEEVIRIMEQCK
ncbi:MAG: ribose-phosphate pyrophosphokinase [Methanosaeta sp. PtaU1.Bin060]|nr:MAG: ribose-phosphate pyrophosphokinase [Methanosaeta sp. PtaU1.Bin060]